MKNAIVLTLTLCLALGAVAHGDLRDGLLVAHDFRDLIDDSGNGHNAVLGGSAYISGGLLYLQGDGGYADIGLETFGPVNPIVDGLSDFTIAIAYASTNTGLGGEGGGGMLLSVGPIATAASSGDFSLFTNNDGQYIDHWWVANMQSGQSGIGYANGTVHLAIVTYEATTDTYTFYHLDGGAAVSHRSGVFPDWSAAWDETLDYTPRIGTSANVNVDLDFGPAGNGAWAYLDGQVDMVAIWNRVLTISEIPEIPDLETKPDPPDGAIRVRSDTVLSWMPGTFAASYDVYFGTSSSPPLVSTAQSQTSYDPPGYLMEETTYYWRIDQRDAEGSVIMAGGVWNFTTARVLYVDADAPGPTHDGLSWGTAFKYLQDALAAVSSGAEIRVAEGIYRPDESTRYPWGTSSRYATFQLVNGVTIYGGFPSGGGQWHQRDPNAYETVLSGDLMGNDGLDFANNGENSYHIVTGSGTDSTAVLDGFTITAGNADGLDMDSFGGGMLNESSSPTLTNCTFSGNSAGDGGGGMYNVDSSLIALIALIAHWTFDEGEGNTAYDSVGNNDGTISGAQWTTGQVGGALEFDGVNDYVEVGDLDLSGSFTLTFWMEPESFPGGWHSTVIKAFDYGCEFNGNTLHGWVADGDWTASTSTTISEPGQWYHVGLTYDGSRLTLYINGNSVDSDSGPHSSNDDPLLIGSWDGYGEFFNGLIDDVRIYERALSAEEIEQLYGIGQYHGIGGGMSNFDGSSPTLTNCIFSGNSAGEVGGGMNNSNGSSPTLTNCTFTGNLAVAGAGIFCENNSNPTITNCTISGNTASGGASDLTSYSFSPVSFNLRDISSTGTPVSLSDDRVSGAIPVLFNFDFYGTEFSEIYISSNGFITFLSGQSNGCCRGQPLPTPGNPDGLIAAFWEDINPPQGGTIRYQTLGSVGSREFIVGFYNVPHYYDDPLVTFEIILHEGTDNIELQYGSAPSDGGTHSVGIENLNGTEGLQVAHGNVSFNNEGFLISRQIQSAGGGISCRDSIATVTNSILWGNRDNSGMGASAQLADSSIVNYSCVQGYAEPTEPPTQGMIAHWRFDEGEGNIAYDSVGENHGTLVGDPQWVDGLVGGALEFDGVDDYVDCGNLGSFPSTGTIGFWMKPYEIANYRNPFTTDFAGSNAGIRFEESDPGRFVVVIAYSGASADIHEYLSVGLQAERWYHVVLTWDSPNNNVRGYLNGVEKFDESQTNWPTALPDVQIGRGYSTSSNRHWDGVVDDVHIYNRALSAEEIEQLYQGESSLISHWTFDEGQGDTAYDSVGDNDGTIYGAQWTAGQVDGALSFDGADDYVDVGNLGLSSEFTVMGWMYYDVSAIDEPIFGSDSPGESRRISLRSNAFEVMPDGVSWENRCQVVFAPVSAGWHHLAGIYNGSQIEVFVDGISQGTHSASSGALDPNPNNYIGRHGAGHNWYMNGLIDDVRIYSRALSAEEIQQLYQEGSALAHWTFDEGQRDIAYDSVGNNDGTIYGAQWTAGQVGGALSFDGVDDYVEVANSASLNPTQEISIEAWIFLHSKNYHNVIVAKANSFTNGYYFLVNRNSEGGVLVANIGDGGGYLRGPAININEWYHVAATYNATKEILYVNGVKVAEKTPSPMIPSSSNLRIGSSTTIYWGGQYFNGIIDDAHIYDRALSIEEIQQHYENGLSGYSYQDELEGNQGQGNIGADPCFVNPEYLWPTSYWKLDESEGDTAYDSTGDNDGTIYGAQWTTGIIGGALEFDGVDDYADFGNKSIGGVFGSGSSVFTVSSWIKPGTLGSSASNHGTRNVILARASDGYNDNFELGVSPEGDLDLYIDENYDDITKTYGGGEITTGSWHHFVCVFDSGSVDIYLDENHYQGSFAGSSLDQAAGSPVTVGATLHSDIYFDGIIDDVRIYDRALSVEEIQQQYENGLSGYGYSDVASPDYHLLPGSPCIDSGDNNSVPTDIHDLDGDGDTAEPIPFDLDGNPRIVDGNDDGIAVVDMGAYEAQLSPHQLVINRIEDAIAEKAEALEKINAALEKELEAFETLEQLLETGDYGDWSREDILGARWKISIAIFYEEDYIKKVLEKNIDKLQRTLSVLGIETDEGNNGDIPVPSVGAYNPAALSVHQLVINLIEEALAEKAEALERIDAALQKERQAYEILEQMLINRDYGDWNRQAILRAKSRIYVAIKYEEYLKKVLMIMTVEKLEDSLSRLAVEPDVGSG